MSYDLRIIDDANIEERLRHSDEIVRAVLQTAAEAVVGRALGTNPKSSPLYRHFVRTNRERYGFAPLSPKYAKWKAKKFPGRPILVRSELLRDSAMENVRFELSEDSVEIVLTVPDWGEYHITGTDKMPARDWTAWRADDEQYVAEAADRAIGAAFQGVGVKPVHSGVTV